MNAIRALFRYCPWGILAVSTAAFAASTPVRIEQTVEPQFPSALAFTPITSGEARVIMIVDDEGTLADLIVASYTDVAFADEAVRLLRLWRYGAATVDGKPVGVRMELQIDFSAVGRVVSLSINDTVNALFANSGARSVVAKVCRPQELDQTLAMLKVVAPPKLANPMAPSEGRPSVVIDFYVDESGQPRLPVVVNSTSDDHARAAVAALNQWRFSAPTCRGQPVVVRARQEFIFTHGS